MVYSRKTHTPTANHTHTHSISIKLYFCTKWTAPIPMLFTCEAKDGRRLTISYGCVLFIICVLLLLIDEDNSRTLVYEFLTYISSLVPRILRNRTGQQKRRRIKNGHELYILINRMGKRGTPEFTVQRSSNLWNTPIL